MAKRITRPKQSVRLKERVESFLSSNITTIKKIPVTDVRNLFEDLQIYQTEIENHSKEMEESERKYRQLFEGAANPITILSRDGIVLMVNTAGAKNLGLPAQACIGKSVTELLPDLDEAYPNLYKQVMDKGVKITGEDLIELPEGPRFFWSSFEPISDIHGKRYGVQVISYDITERKLAGEALRESEERLKDFFNSATDSFVFFDAELNIIQVSKAHMEMFHPGMDEDDLIGRNLLEIVPNLKETGRYDDFMKVIQTGTPYYADDIIPDPKFGYRILSVKAFKLASGLGTITADVTKQRKTEMALLKNAEWYRNFLENLNAVVFEGDNSGNMTYVNKMGESITGVLLEDIIGKSFLPFFDIKSREVAIEEYQRTLNGESPQYELTLNNGKILHFKNEPLRNKDGDIIGVFGVARDITEAKQAEAALKESEAKHKTLIKNIPGMVYRAYPDWSAEVISGSETICGYTEKELNSEKNNWLSIIHHADKEKVFKDGSELTQAQKNIVQTYRIKTKGDDIRWVEDRKASLISKEGKFIGIDGIVFDITDRKQAEEALNKVNALLEEKVTERTTEIEEKNVALKVLLDQRGGDKKKHEETIMSNVKELLMPNLNRLKNSTLSNKQQTAVNILESNLNEIISPFANSVSSSYMKLTPTEIQVANFIKHGLSSKDIADSLSLSQRTVDTHRYNIRKKLGIRGKGVNLRTYLMSLT